MKTLRYWLFALAIALPFPAEASENFSNKDAFLKALNAIIGVENASFGTKEFDRIAVGQLNHSGACGPMLETLFRKSEKYGIATDVTHAGSHLFISWIVGTDDQQIIEARVQIIMTDDWHTKDVYSFLKSRPAPLEGPMGKVQ